MILNTIINTDCLTGLRELPDSCVDCCVTSPPYYGLRDYGEDGQIGLEETPESYVQKLVDVFREVKRVLKPEGTLWLNLGDSYWGGKGASSQAWTTEMVGKRESINGQQHQIASKGETRPTDKKHETIKPKDLIGIPWMVAFALRADGWYLRQDIIWNKPNPMPESVTDRCTKAHEYIFLLSKSQQYYYDADAIKFKTITNPNSPKTANGDSRECNSGRVGNNGEYANKRSVWTVTTKPFSEAHFATFPEDLIVPCIKAGCPEKGIVLDPFMGAGTTGLVARKLTRNFIGFELNPEYIKIAENRIRPHLQQVSIFDMI